MVRRWCSGLVFTVLTGFGVGQLGLESAFAASYAVECPKSAPSGALYRSAIKDKVLREIDGTKFTNVKVNVGLSRRELKTAPVTVTTADLTPELGFTPGSPLGLGFFATGMMDYAVQCEWRYRVRITVRATSVDSKKTVRSTNVSDISIRRSVNGRFKKIAQ
jgi:hypothetical protein